MRRIVKLIKLEQKDACVSLNKNKYKPPYLSGFMLIEVMISIAIITLLLSLLMEIYLASQKSLKLQTALYHIQNNAQEAISILSDEIQRAGMIGCARLSNDFPIISYGEYKLNPKNKLIGNISNEISIRYAEYPNNFLIENMKSNNTIIANKTVRFKQGDVLLISNCKQAEIFIANKVEYKSDMQEIFPLTPLHDQYEKYSEISKFAINKFYIAASHRNINGASNYSLFLEDIHHYKTELVIGINQMRIKYTVNQARPFIDVPAQQVINWDDILGVAIDLDLSAPPLKKTWHMYMAVQR